MVCKHYSQLLRVLSQQPAYWRSQYQKVKMSRIVEIFIVKVSAGESISWWIFQLANLSAGESFSWQVFQLANLSAGESFSWWIFQLVNLSAGESFSWWIYQLGESFSWWIFQLANLSAGESLAGELFQLVNLSAGESFSWWIYQLVNLSAGESFSWWIFQLVNLSELHHRFHWPYTIWFSFCLLCWALIPTSTTYYSLVPRLLCSGTRNWVYTCGESLVFFLTWEPSKVERG